MAVNEQAAAELDAGWAALRAGRWDAARRSFSAAVAQRETPQALEGLSWATWWLDDAPAMFAARERAFQCYREQGDAAGAARMATWLAADHLDFHGALAVANGWLERAARLLEPLDPAPDHGWLAFHRGFIAELNGQAAEAEADAALAADLGRRFAVPDLEMLGLALEGMSLVSRARVRDGMRRLDEASAIALSGEASIPISAAWTCCFLVTSCTRILDFERAFEWCDRIAEFAERYGSRYMLGFCHAEYADVHLWRGRWQEAEQSLQRSVAAYEASRPSMAAGPLARLAELRRRQGRTAESRALLDRAGAAAAAQLCRAHITLDAGDTDAAVALARRLVRSIPEERPLDRLPALELLTRAQLANGAPDAAAAALEGLREIAREVGTTALEARVSLLEGMVTAALRDHDAALPMLEKAVDTFERCRAPFEAAGARLELATTLRALGRDQYARLEADAADRCLRDLGAAAANERASRPAEPGADPARNPLTIISRREVDVLRLLTEGLTNRQIAERLFISEHTVHRHVTSILRKLEAPSRAAAAAFAVRHRWFGEPPP